jgi:hypothetical protein
MGWAWKTLWFSAALVALSALSSCESGSKDATSSASSASPSAQGSHKAEYRRTVVTLASDVARWKADLQSVYPRKLCAERTADAALDAAIADGTNDLNALQSRIPSMAQSESLAGDIDLSTALHGLSADATKVQTLLGCAPPRSPVTAKNVASNAAAAAEKIQRWRQELAERTAKIQALSMAAVQTPALMSGEEEASARLKDVAEVAKALAWPLAVAVLLLFFRRPLSRFLEQIAGKITKVSVFEVSLELATVPSAPTPWLDPQVYAGTELFGGEVTTTTIMTLFDRIRDDTVWKYLIVDLKDGRQWLESRLYLFTSILQQMGGLRIVIFVRSSESEYQGFIGMAKPEDVRRALEEKYSWFRQILEQSFSAAGVVATFDPLPATRQLLSRDVAKVVSEKFIFDPEMQTPNDPEIPGWSQLKPGGSWDHSHWLTVERFNTDLRRVLFNPALSQLEDTPDISNEKRTRALLRRPVPFVAIVNRNGEFQRLVDRQVLIEQVAARIGTEADEPAPAKAE